ncbi:MATE family efflux transporter [Saccharospirillum salsuginis]|uniref:Multidrug export protein MepA n=1 Tax=Saccharospirillum salsuginis TaxID=418750 RepID=A0A918NGL8_9GAMM|nr:MATE family efflux transporter [Saccharospirillum salsuginis]GGX66007.1 MATE family efflux transporter [Saccharospirillum salsuginis]
MSSLSESPEDRSSHFTHLPLPKLYLQTALPIIFVMGMNGLLTVVDALFLGIFVGPEALGAVTLMFPAYMLIVALSTLVASGMSSILARCLGGREFDQARIVFAAAHGLAIVIGTVLIAGFLLAGDALTLRAANGNATLAAMGSVYLRLTVFFSPVLFVLALQSDALRNEGRAGLMAAMSLLVSIANMGFNYLLIGVLELGVAGSAYGTLLAQCLALACIATFRVRGRTPLRLNGPSWHPANWGGIGSLWSDILRLGAPQSLTFLGLALGSGSIILALQWVGAAGYADTVSAYGIVTRIMTFVFLPLLGLSHAMQSITGNNYGARLWFRSDDSLRLALAIALVYCVVSELVLVSLAAPLGGLFVDDPAVVSEVGRILPIMVSLYVVAGPVMMLATYFQAIGDAGRAALLSLTKPYLFAIPLTFLLPGIVGETGIWLAVPVAEGLLLVVAVVVLTRTARQHGWVWGLFRSQVSEVTS